MIPDHLIDKALNAWIGDHNCPHPDLIHVYRVLITRSLEAVAGDIFQHGYNLGKSDSLLDRIGIDAPNNPNPYRNERA